MARKFTKFLILALFISVSLAAQTSPSNQKILNIVLQKARENEKMAAHFGFYQATTIRKLDDGKVTSQDLKLYRLTWIQDQPYLELLKVNGREPDENTRKDEAARKLKFLKSMNKKEKDDDQEDNISWEDLYAKYDFQMLSAETPGQYVFSFKPKEEKLSERSRAEKVLNHVTGKLWVDDEFNIVAAEASLIDNVRFGLGILGNLEKLEIRYKQQSFDRVRMPSLLFIHFKARIALLKTEERQIQATYTDYFRRPDAVPAQN